MRTVEESKYSGDAKADAFSYSAAAIVLTDQNTVVSLAQDSMKKEVTLNTNLTGRFRLLAVEEHFEGGQR